LWLLLGQDVLEITQYLERKSHATHRGFFVVKILP